MNPVLIYFLKVNIAIALFYGFYKLFFSKDTFFIWRRVALLSFFIISLSYPFLNIQEWIQEKEPIVAITDLYVNSVLPEFDVIITPTAESSSWNTILYTSAMFLYWGVLCMLAGRFIMQLISLCLIGFRSSTSYLNGIKIHILSNEEGPFSFFSKIFISPDAHNEEELNEILMHELTHARQLHSIDVLISELFCTVCWFNPFVWLMRREVRCNLEFLADNKVIEKGYNSKIYQYHLLRLTHQRQVATLSNNFNFLPIKNRIKMMNKKRTPKARKAKYLIFIPLAVLLLIISNIETIARNAERIIAEVIQPQSDAILQENEEVEYKGRVVDQSNKPVPGVTIHVAHKNSDDIKSITTNNNGEYSFKGREQVDLAIFYKQNGELLGGTVAICNINDEDRLNKIIKIHINSTPKVPQDPNNPVFEIVETMPDFPGGQTALMEYLIKNVQYPASAHKNGVQGRVIVQFIINKDGSVSDAEVVRSVDPDLDAEAIRVISNSPKWEPGKQRGKNVRVKYTVPISFRLGNDSAPTEVQMAKREPIIDENGVYELAEEMPQFVGGTNGLIQYLSKSINYPEKAKANGVQGRVIVQFIVKSDGSVADPKVVRSIDAELDAEAIRIIKSMPKWTPGKQGGENIDTKYAVPVNFQF